VRDLDCNEVVELVTAYLDNALPAEDAESVLAHLSLCDGCSTYIEQIRTTTARLRALQPPGRLDATARSELLSQFRERTAD